MIKRTALLGIWLCMALLAGTAIAAEEHKVVVQVSDDDARTQRVALNNTMNLLAEFGSKAEVEIVAYGPGLSLLTANSRYADRVTEMAARYGVVFSACRNTMEGIKRRTGQAPTLADGVRVVPSGIARIVELQNAGWTYVRP